MGRVVLVTGVSMDLGRRMARQLTALPDVDHVVGVDVLPHVATSAPSPSSGPTSATR